MNRSMSRKQKTRSVSGARDGSLIGRRRGWINSQSRSESAQLVGGFLAGATVGHDLVGDSLVLGERAQTGTLNSTDVNEHILAAVVRRDKAVTLGLVEPLNLACSQNMFSLS